MVALNYAPTLAAAPGPSPEALALQQEYAKHLLQGSDQPIHSWSQGLAGVVDALVGGTMMRKAGERQSAAEAAASAADASAQGQSSDLIMALMNPAGAGQTPGAPPDSASSPPPDAGDMFGSGLAAALPAAGGAAPAGPPPASAGAPAIDPAQVRAVLANPRIPAATKAQILELWKAQNAPPAIEKPTDDMREYAASQRDPAFRQYLIDQKQAGRSQVSIDQRGEGAEAQERGKAVVQHFKTLAEDLPAADQLANGVSQLETLLQGVDTGSEAALRSWIADNTGVALGDNVDKLQSITALTDYMAPRMRVPGSGSSSDRDVAMFKSALPSLIRQPGGNQIIIDTLRSMANHRLAVAQISEDYLTGQIESKDALAKMRGLPDPMEDFKKAAPPPEAPAASPTADAAPETPPPSGINPDEWGVMTPEERALFGPQVAAPVASPEPSPIGKYSLPKLGTLPGERLPPKPSAVPLLGGPMRVINGAR